MYRLRWQLPANTGVVAVPLNNAIAIDISVAGITHAIAIQVELARVKHQRTIIVAGRDLTASASRQFGILKNAVPIIICLGAALAIPTIHWAGVATFTTGLTLQRTHIITALYFAQLGTHTAGASSFGDTIGAPRSQTTLRPGSTNTVLNHANATTGTEIRAATTPLTDTTVLRAGVTGLLKLFGGPGLARIIGFADIVTTFRARPTILGTGLTVFKLRV